ncbi:MAG: DUF177 domain-containing protein [Bacteroidales bacterium]|nr:DUF177 domain-containing protein [Bacteroidales bacterium]
MHYKELSIGKHNYSFCIDKRFFEKNEYPEVKSGKVKVDLELEKKEKLLFLRFLISGKVTVMCDRCLDYYDQPVEGEEALTLKIGNASVEESYNVSTISEAQNEIDISDYIYEYICLLIPLKRVHPEDKNGKSLCNKEMINKINELSVNDSIDSRWEILKKISFNN